MCRNPIYEHQSLRQFQISNVKKDKNFVSAVKRRFQ